MRYKPGVTGRDRAFLSIRQKTIGNGPTVLLQLVECLNMEGLYSVPQIGSSLKTVFKIAELSISPDPSLSMGSLTEEM